MRPAPLVSVYIPTRNRLEKLERALRSVLGQTYANHEILVCDDASTDGTFERISRLARSERKIRYLRNPAPRGACSARNLGIFAARGEFITGLDDDDEFTPRPARDPARRLGRRLRLRLQQLLEPAARPAAPGLLPAASADLHAAPVAAQEPGDQPGADPDRAPAGHRRLPGRRQAPAGLGYLATPLQRLRRTLPPGADAALRHAPRPRGGGAARLPEHRPGCRPRRAVRA
ncbi:glycosyltransferase family 2 protein [Azotobacter vinelandii]